ncbi:SusC/RagA family TonB-dependent receptor precursor [Tenacibaculum sp. 190524A02b]|uniref:SusC/RagA family TonB-linked outer membrane protein n=1 Tax=Tenacibaculum vairaonense TaxID=3137860 RepID=UPI0032B109E0
MKKNKISLLLFCFSFLLIQVTIAQEKTITGVVTSKADGEPLPGVSVLIQGTTKGVETDFDGNYEIKVNTGDTLTFTYVGMSPKSVIILNQTTLNIALEEGNLLKEVVVTALGIKKEKKALTYAAQEVGGDELTKVKQTNPINSLSGKSAGITINRSSSGLGGAAKVVLRGNSSTTNNDPLYVIDGVPMLNQGNGSNGSEPGTDIFGGQTGNRDGGDAMSMINPDDIESISVLRGASAAALYGSQGGNGVVLITTKSGKKGRLSVNFSSSLTIDNVLSLPKLQSEYQSPSVGQPIAENGNVTDPKSWGTKASGLRNDYAENFFNTGYTSVQAITLSVGTEKAQTFFSYANTIAEGVIPENRMIRNNVNVKETMKFFDDKLSVTANVNLSDQRINNRPGNGLYANVLTGLYLNPVGINLDNYKRYEYFNVENNMMDQYATSFDENIQQNPYWLIHRNPSGDIAQKVLAGLSLKYQFTDNFSLQSRGSFDKSFFTYEKKMYAGSDPNLVPNHGRYILEKTENTQQYIDLIGNYKLDISDDFTANILVGTSLTKYRLGDQISLDSGLFNLTHPNWFSIQNFASTKNIAQNVSNRELQSVFGSLNLGFKEMLFLDVTTRTDWSSTLTKPFSYPSVGLTGVLSEMIEMPDAISFAKVRGSYAEVGTDIPVYATNPLAEIRLGVSNYTDPQIGPRVGDVLKPQRQKSFEVGTEWRFFGNRLGLDFTYYNTKTTDQIFYVQAEPNTKGYVQNIVNAGEIKNSGIELTLTGKPIVNDNFTWETNVNLATNNSEVVSVHPELGGEAILTPPGVNGYRFALVEGEEFGSIQARKLLRNSNGVPMTVDGALQKTDFETVGSAQPDFTLGWNNSFTLGNISFNFLIDSKFGGEVLSVTEAVNDQYGVSQATADARNANGGMINVVDKNGASAQLDAKDYFGQVGGRAGILGEYVYDATNIRLAEVSLGYNFDFKDNFIKKMRISLIGNNLFFIHKEAPFDPNITASTGLGLQGVDIYGQPSTRSVGLNINLNF